MPVSFKDILEALEFVSAGGMGEHQAFLCKQSGRVYWHSEFSDELGELPDDIEDSEKYVPMHRRLLAIVRDDDICRRLMTTPGVGPVVALTYRATVDVPARFRNSKAVGAVFGLTPSKHQ